MRAAILDYNVGMHLIAKNLKKFYIKKKTKKSADFFLIILIGSVSASDPMIVYRVTICFIYVILICRYLSEKIDKIKSNYTSQSKSKLPILRFATILCFHTLKTVLFR